MTIRLIVQHTDTSNMSPYGGTHITDYRSFEIEHPELEKLLRERNNQHEQHQVVGAELLGAKAGGAA